MQKRRPTKRKATTRALLGSQAEQQEILANENDVQIWLSKAMKLSGAENANDEARSVLDYFARRSGLLLPRGEGQFAFMHLSLQEYFAACYLEQHLAAPRFQLFLSRQTHQMKPFSLGQTNRLGAKLLYSRLKSWQRNPITQSPF